MLVSWSIKNPEESYEDINVKSFGWKDGEVKPDIVKVISEFPITPLILSIEDPIVEQNPVKPIKALQLKFWILNVFARLIIKDLGMAKADGVREIVIDYKLP